MSCSAAVPQSLAPCRDAPGTTAPTCVHAPSHWHAVSAASEPPKDQQPSSMPKHRKACSHHDSRSLDWHQQQAAQEVDHQQRHQNRRAAPAKWAQLVPKTFAEQAAGTPTQTGSCTCVAAEAHLMSLSMT
jgi:hypothetical protein